MRYKLLKALPGFLVGHTMSEDVWVDAHNYDPRAFPDWFEKEAEKPKFKVGDWAITTTAVGIGLNMPNIGDIFRITDIKTYGSSDNLFFKPSYGVDAIRCRLATKEEIETHLIAMAKQKGLVEGAITDKTELIDTIISGTCLEYRDINKTEALRYNGIGPKVDYRYDAEDDILYCLGWIIYIAGKWAKIAPETIKLAGFETKEGNKGWINIGCQELTKTDAETFYLLCKRFNIKSLITAHSREAVSIDSVHNALKKLKVI